MSVKKIKSLLSQEDKEIWKYDDISIFNNFIDTNNFESFEDYISKNSLNEIYTINKNHIKIKKETFLSISEFNILVEDLLIDLSFFNTSLNKFIFNIVKDTNIKIQIHKSVEPTNILNYLYFNINNNCKIKVEIVSNGSNFEKNIIKSNQEDNSVFSIITRSLLIDNNKIDFSIISKINGKNCILNQDLKAVLYDKSQFSSLGEINISKLSDNADAKHYTSTISMSDNAIIYARPFLKIDNGNVKCAHGCPSGYISDSDLFYMRSRGLTKKVAEKIYIYSFLNEESDLIKNILEK